jgi:hypothetical protein
MARHPLAGLKHLAPPRPTSCAGAGLFLSISGARLGFWAAGRGAKAKRVGGDL